MGYMMVAFILVCLQMMTVSMAFWHNNFKQTLSARCANDYVLTLVHSDHNSTHKDRRWSLWCRKEIFPRTCEWTNYINNFGQFFFSFECPNGGFINGMHSTFHHGHSDRRWRFYCCTKTNYTTGSCIKTSWKFTREDYSVYVPLKYFLTGVRSLFSTFYRDRYVQYKLCTLKKK